MAERDSCSDTTRQPGRPHNRAAYMKDVFTGATKINDPDPDRNGPPGSSAWKSSHP